MNKFTRKQITDAFGSTIYPEYSFDYTPGAKIAACILAVVMIVLLYKFL